MGCHCLLQGIFPPQGLNLFLMFATLAGNYLVPSGKGFKSENVSHSVTRSTPWTVAHQAPLAMEFSRQKYWGGAPFPCPGDLPDPGIEPEPPALAGRFFTTSATWEEEYFVKLH